jgi:hypothetical protein
MFTSNFLAFILLSALFLLRGVQRGGGGDLSNERKGSFQSTFMNACNIGTDF